jgi:hypothetical protein
MLIIIGFLLYDFLLLVILLFHKILLLKLKIKQVFDLRFARIAVPGLSKKFLQTALGFFVYLKI